MELSQALAAIKQLISQGNLEEAYDQLLKLLDAFAEYGELADIARINQADLYQLKAQTLKGIVTAEDAKLSTNQLANNALQIIRQLETGKISFEENIKPNSSKAWRYYVIGGVVALALGLSVWQLIRIFGNGDDCPKFSDSVELRVVILPFKQTGKEKSAVRPEFDISDDLNDLLDQTPGLHTKALADVYEKYDIDKDYPNSAQAVEIARHCQAQMLVWGKVNQANEKDYTLDVRYRLLDAGGVRYAGDTTISRLLSVTEEAGWTSDVKAITRLLYMVLANRMQVPIAADVLKQLEPVAVSALPAGSVPAVDTSTRLILADYFILKKEYDKAIAEYDSVLTYDPQNNAARTKRGALLLQKKDYRAAALDLEGVEPADSKTAKAIHMARIEALLKSDQPEKARQEVESAQKEKSVDGAWLDRKSQEVHDSTVALQVRRDQLERAATSTKTTDARVGAARANLGLGETTEALRFANDALKADPKNLEAVTVAVEAHLQKGDTASATKTIHAAERAGANVKSITRFPIRQRILPDRQH